MIAQSINRLLFSTSEAFVLRSIPQRQGAISISVSRASEWTPAVTNRNHQSTMMLQDIHYISKGWKRIVSTTVLTNHDSKLEWALFHTPLWAIIPIIHLSEQAITKLTLNNKGRRTKRYYTHTHTHSSRTSTPNSRRTFPFSASHLSTPSSPKTHTPHPHLTAIANVTRSEYQGQDGISLTHLNVRNAGGNE